MPSDTQAPEARSFEFSPGAVNVGGAPAEVTFTVRATDDLSGIRDIGYTCVAHQANITLAERGCGLQMVTRSRERMSGPQPSRSTPNQALGLWRACA
jgi:hypothetical protein